jgi:predicted lipoprotein
MKSKISVLFILVLVLAACKKPEELETPGDTSFQSVLTNFSSAIPAQYASFADHTLSLTLAAEDLRTSPNASNLEVLQNELFETRKAWQWICMFNFGPAETNNLSSINTFPADTTSIKNKIESETLQGFSPDETGFAALDFLLHREAALSSITEEENANHVLDLIVSHCESISNKANSVRNEWNGSYAANFKANTGAAAGSGMSLLVNHFVICYEQLKREKVALPLGLLTLGIPLVDHVEARYGAYSSTLALEQITALNAVFNGFDTAEMNSIGLAEALREVDARYGANQVLLDEEINGRFSVSINNLSQLPSDLRTFISESPDELESIYNQLQSTVALVKADMPSSLGISITFSDNDGD